MLAGSISDVAQVYSLMNRQPERCWSYQPISVGAPIEHYFEGFLELPTSRRFPFFHFFHLFPVSVFS
jgi:hypothetical protein